MNITEILQLKLTGLKRLISYTGSESEEQRKDGDAGNYSTTLDYSDMTVGDLLDWTDEIIKIRKLQAPLKRKIYPPKEFKVTRKGTRGSVQMTDEAALLQFAQGDQATYDRWVAKYGSANQAVKEIRSFMEQLRANH